MVPPRIIRRLVLAPLVFVLLLALIVLLPLPLLAAAVLAPWLRGRQRVLRLLVFALVYAVLEAAAVLSTLGLWVASGFGWRLRSRRFQDAHYALLGGLLRTLVRVAERVFRLRIEVQGPLDPSRGQADLAGRSLIVLARHAGPGDSFLLVHHLMTLYRRRPRIVMKDVLQLDPVLDVIGHRLPNAFVRPKPGVDVELTAYIGELAAGLGPDGVLVIFPEGGNFSTRRRLRSIQWLEQHGRTWEARVARRMQHMLAPRTSGVIAALDAAPEADVVFVTHTGLADLQGVVDIWRGIPMAQTVRARWWHVAARTIPTEHEERVRWLYQWWGRMDAWVADHETRSLPPTS